MAGLAVECGAFSASPSVVVDPIPVATLDLSRGHWSCVEQLLQPGGAV